MESSALPATNLAFRLLGERGFERARSEYMALKIRTGRYRDDEIDVLSHVVGPGDTVLDVGANFGLYSFHLARLVGARGRVHAFEALPSTAVALRRVLRALRVDGRVTVTEKALGDFRGSAAMAFSRRDDGSVQRGGATLVAPGAQPSGTSEQTVVQVTRIDDEVPADAEISFVKVDVEGADLAALRGGASLIERCAPTVLIEVAPRLLEAHGDSAAAVEGFFDEHGYATYRYDRRAGSLAPCRASESSDNVLAVHPRREATIRALRAA